MSTPQTQPQPQILPAPSSPTTLVRRFTDSLDGLTPLSAGTKIAQARIDVQVASRERLRTQILYSQLDDDNASEPFREAELVRRALQTAADEFFENTENDSRKRESRMKIFRKSSKPGVESRVEQRMRQSNVGSLDDVKTLVGEMGDEWKRKHGKVHGYFTRICKTLDAHKSVLKVVPNQNTYVQVLSGALTMVVQASVYHAEIAENLAVATAHLCERVAVCSQLVDVIRSRDMQRQLASIYTALFLFLLKVAKWFNKSASGRFFDSLNASVKQEHDDAVAAINRSIDFIMEQGGVEELARMEYVHRTVDIIEWKLEKNVVEGIAGLKMTLDALGDRVDAVRIQNVWQSQRNIEQAGRLMLTHFEAMIDQKLQHLQRMEYRNEERQGKIAHETEFHEAAIHGVTLLTREQVDLRCKFLAAYVQGTDGLFLAQESQVFFIDPTIVSRIRIWIGGVATESQKLWIEFPFEYQEETSARATALGIISLSATADAPFLSYICRKPNKADVPKEQTVEDAGILSLVCSLILQLLRFRPEYDGFFIDSKLLDGLSSGTENWPAALHLMGILLDHTPVLRYCILHGMNELESGDGGDKTTQVLKVLFDRCQKADSPFSVLLTTSGQSRGLGRMMQSVERVRSDATMSTVTKIGYDLKVGRMWL